MYKTTQQHFFQGKQNNKTQNNKRHNRYTINKGLSTLCGDSCIKESGGGGGDFPSGPSYPSGPSSGKCRKSSGKCRNSLKSKFMKDKRFKPFTPSSKKKIDSSPKVVSRRSRLKFPSSRDEELQASRSSSSSRHEAKSLSNAPSSSSSTRFVVNIREIEEFFRLTDDPLIKDFLKADTCKKVADKYLIAMVFIYFKKAQFTLDEYTRFNFFVCLYLAHDMEEDEEEVKYEIFPWALGRRWRDTFPELVKARDRLFRRIGYKAVVSRKACDEVMGLMGGAPLWNRERPEHHAGAQRACRRSEDGAAPRGPTASPQHCELCCPKGDSDSQYDSASPASTCWYVSSQDSDSLESPPAPPPPRQMPRRRVSPLPAPRRHQPRRRPRHTSSTNSLRETIWPKSEE